MRYLILAACLLTANSAAAQQSADVLIARVCVSEGGWDNGPDCDAIVYVIRSRAERLGLTLREMVAAYSGRVLDTARTDRRRWLAHLTAAGTFPAGWPVTTSWERHRVYWLATVERVRRLLARPLRAPCESHVDHWAARSVDRSSIWTRVDCGATHNVFWRVPR